jgi:hypothetical protein
MPITHNLKSEDLAERIYHILKIEDRLEPAEGLRLSFFLDVENPGPDEIRCTIRDVDDLKVLDYDTVEEGSRYLKEFLFYIGFLALLILIGTLLAMTLRGV